MPQEPKRRDEFEDLKKQVATLKENQDRMLEEHRKAQLVQRKRRRILRKLHRLILHGQGNQPSIMLRVTRVEERQVELAKHTEAATVAKIMTRGQVFAAVAGIVISAGLTILTILLQK